MVCWIRKKCFTKTHPSLEAYPGPAYPWKMHSPPLSPQKKAHLASTPWNVLPPPSTSPLGSLVFPAARGSSDSPKQPRAPLHLRPVPQSCGDPTSSSLAFPQGIPLTTQTWPGLPILSKAKELQTHKGLPCACLCHPRPPAMLQSNVTRTHKSPITALYDVSLHQEAPCPLSLLSSGPHLSPCKVSHQEWLSALRQLWKSCSGQVGCVLLPSSGHGFPVWAWEPQGHGGGYNTEWDTDREESSAMTLKDSIAIETILECKLWFPKYISKSYKPKEKDKYPYRKMGKDD